MRTLAALLLSGLFACHSPTSLTPTQPTNAPTPLKTTPHLEKKVHPAAPESKAPESQTPESKAPESSTSATPKILASGSPTYFLAMDQDFIYWIDHTRGVIKSARKDGAETLLGGTFVNPLAITIDDSLIYIGDSGTIWVLSKQGGKINKIALGGRAAYQIATDKQSLYWTDYITGEVIKSDKDGGNAITLATDAPGSTGLAIDDSYVYWTNFYTGKVSKVSKAGGSAEVLASEQRAPLGIVVEGGVLYWANYSGATLMKLEPKGEPTIVAEEQSEISFLALDKDYLYWTTYGVNNGGKSGVFRANRRGAGVTQLATDQLGALQIAADTRGLAWVNYNYMNMQGNITTLEK